MKATAGDSEKPEPVLLLPAGRGGASPFGDGLVGIGSTPAPPGAWWKRGIGRSETAATAPAVRNPSAVASVLGQPSNPRGPAARGPRS